MKLTKLRLFFLINIWLVTVQKFTVELLILENLLIPMSYAQPFMYCEVLFFFYAHLLRKGNYKLEMSGCKLLKVVVELKWIFGVHAVMWC